MGDRLSKGDGCWLKWLPSKAATYAVWAAHPQGEPPLPSSVGTVALELHRAPPVWLLGTGTPSRRILSAEWWKLVPLQNYWGGGGAGADDGGPWKQSGQERKNQEWGLGGLPWWSSGKDVTFKNRGCTFDPWSERSKILHALRPKKKTSPLLLCNILLLKLLPGSSQNVLTNSIRTLKMVH